MVGLCDIPGGSRNNSSTTIPARHEALRGGQAHRGSFNRRGVTPTSSRAAIPKNRALRKDIRGSGVLGAAVRAERGKTLAQVSDLLLMLDTD
jgi:hypothetical protein